MRLLRHLFARSARHLFPEDSLHRIADAIAAGELRHRGEILFAVESELSPGMVLRGVQARARAEAAFARLRAWDTEANNGVLIYLLLADHRIEVVADRGLNGLVSAEQWRGACLLMEERMHAGEPVQAVVRGIEAVSDLLAQHFPQTDGAPDRDELPNLPLILD
ncbi:MAG: TPM domain-containing protein [Pseudoxanthomonas sp.]